MTAATEPRSPTLDLELATYQEIVGQSNDTHCLIAGMDEVGRGALAGNVTVGCVVIDPTNAEALAGVKDSKLVPEKVRSSLVGPIQQWAVGHGVGHASAQEIDERGITVGLRLAGHRAFKLATAQIDARIQILLDGNTDWFSPQFDLFSAGLDIDYVDPCPPVQTVVKGDLRCLSIAAASILAKVARDEQLIRLDEEYPEYGWKQNKGYGSKSHRLAIKNHGASSHHRHSWLSKILVTQQGETA